ncbi:MAG: MFS transporter [Candidatus Binatia bacterium]|nr:MFS transporter [Candidatus Binatia bacterium]
MPAATPFTNLLGGMASWFLFWGTSQVMFQWLVVEGLGAPATLVGTAQMAMMLPSLLFVLIGGAAADRLDPRRVLLVVHFLTAAVAGALCFLVVRDELSYEWLIGYALAVGTLQAFGMPARDTQLSDVVRHAGLSRAVAGLTMVQHMAQMCGAFIGGLATFAGPGPIIASQAAFLLVGTGFVARLPGRPKAPDEPRKPIRLQELREGLLEVVRSPILRPVFLLSITTGMFFIGPFLVILPLIVRDVYGGGAGEMGILTGMFPLGAVGGGAVIVSRGGIERNGRALAIGQILGATSIASIGIGLPFEGTALSVLLWGVSGSLFINTGRTLFQQHASAENRGRVLSVYTLGLMGASPFGSVLSGALAEPLGLHGTLVFSAVTAGAAAAVLCLTTRLWSLR